MFIFLAIINKHLQNKIFIKYLSNLDIDIPNNYNKACKYHPHPLMFLYHLWFVVEFLMSSSN
jgi:hypothetical protein